MKRFLLIALLVLSCATSWGQVLDLGNGLFLPNPNLLALVGSSPASLTMTINAVQQTPDGFFEVAYDRDGAWAGATYTAPIDQTIFITGSLVSQTTGAVIFSGSLSGASATGYGNFNLFALYDSATGYAKGTGGATVKMAAGQTLSFKNYATAANSTKSFWLSISRIR